MEEEDEVLLLSSFSTNKLRLSFRSLLTSSSCLISILFANSINSLILSFIFSIEINYFEIIANITFTFLLYFLFARIFNYLKPVGI